MEKAIAEAGRMKAEVPRSQAEDGETAAWLRDLNLWELKIGRHGRGGPKTHTYSVASWREGENVQNVHSGSSRKL